MSSQAQKVTAGATEAQESSLLDQIVEQGRLARDPEAKTRNKDVVKEFIGQFLEGSMTLSRDSELMINARIAQIDHLISLQLNEVMHNPNFQKLEGTWRGLRYLLDKTETSVNLKLKIFNATKKELLRDLQRASEFDQSAMFKKVYEEEFGQFGGHPFGCLVGDYEFSKSPEDLELLEKVSQVAAAAHAPLLSAASASLFNLDGFTELSAPRDLAKIFDTTEYAKWKSFRNSDDSRYVALTVPHILMREPYGKATRPVDEFDYEEGVDGTDHSKYLWGNAAWALASRVTESFARYNWCATIRGVEGGGKVEGLCVHNFTTDEGDIAI
ncbi:MAG: type VI secretion system contractile sheath large subunit, partial [Acidobacteriaceae bacterium]|nr:type VI secretion system contractile sheath large subunit [Acidobacteriaceae bacterium]